MFARALYAGYSGSADNLEVGYLKSPLLLKVYPLYSRAQAAAHVATADFQAHLHLPGLGKGC